MGDEGVAGVSEGVWSLLEGAEKVLPFEGRRPS